MSSTQASQTLFSFVSVRSPQLSDEDGKVRRFIYRPEDVKKAPLSVNVFDAAAADANTANRWELLNNAAAAFKNSAAYLSDESSVEELAGSVLYKFAVWLARNKDSFTNDEFQQKASEAANGLKSDAAARLWNNLFYQVITQESFYIKEAIMQVLTANHVISNLDTNDTFRGIQYDAANALATIVLPKEIFIGTLAGSNTGVTEKAVAARSEKDDAPSETPAASLPTASLKKKLAVLDAKQLNDQYAAAKKEVAQIEKEYKTEYSAAYEAEFQKHREVIKPIMDEYIEKREE